MKGPTVRRIGWAAALLMAGASIGPPVAAQEASPTGDTTTAQTTQPAQQDDGNEVPWGLLGLLGLAGLAGLRRRDEPRTVQSTTDGAKTYAQR